MNSGIDTTSHVTLRADGQVESVGKMEQSSIPQDTAIPLLVGEEKHHAFISHSTEDLKFSEELLGRLESFGFKCFHSKRDFEAGKTIVKNIVKGIKESRRVLVIISKAMMKSSWVEFEVANSKAKANEKEEVVFIPILYNIEPSDVPGYVKEINYLEENDLMFWPKLAKSLTETIPLTATIPVGNIAHGIVWSYYYGYLALVLPGLVDRTKKSKFYGDPNIQILPKMVIVLPETCNCPGDVKTVDENVTFAGYIDFKATRAGKIARDYKTAVWKVKDPDNGQEFYTLLEYATPLLSMYEMEQGRIANLDSHEKFRQMMLFKEKLREILEHPSNPDCIGKSVIIQFKDEKGSDDGERLSRVLAKCARDELEATKKKEGTDMEH